MLSLASPSFAQPKANEDDPIAEHKLLTLPPGFELQLVAAEPAIINPVQINFDPQGRLWVLCLPRYPQLLPGQDPTDFITILEDFDITGKAKKTTIFAEGLTVPTGMAPGDGGVYVGQADQLIHLKDGKGTGKATERRVLLAGFGTQDTHHTLNTFRWGPDGNLYFNQGVYIKSDVETPYGLRRYWGGGTWQLRPDRLQLEVFDRSIADNNTWGHAFNPWGRSLSTSAWPANVNLVLPDSPLNSSRDKDVIPPLALTKVSDGRHCGATFISGRHFPDDWHGNLVSGSFASQVVYRFKMADNGSSFVGKQTTPVVSSKHRKFRPVDMQMGPDGALYIADWYNEVIQHNQIDFRDPRRDHSHGRIWRVVAKDRPLLPIPKLVGVPVAAVLDHLKSPEDWTRQQAKRALAERDANEVKTALDAWVKKLDPKEPLAPRHLLEALWTAQSIDRVDVELLTRVMRSEDPRARAAAARVAGAWADRLADPLGLLAALTNDPDPRVRLEAVLAVSRVPAPKAIEVAMFALDHAPDPLVDFAVKRTAIILRPYWYPAFHKGQLSFGGRSRHLAAALQAIRSTDALPKLAALLEAKQIPEANRAAVYTLLASGGDAKLQRLAWDAITGPAPPPPSGMTAILDALELAARERKTTPAGDLTAIKDLLNHTNADVAAAAIRLAGAWRYEPGREAIVELARNEHPARRRAAVAALVTLGGPKSVESLEKLSAGNNPYPVRVQALAGLTAIDAKRAANLAATLLQSPAAAGDDPTDLFLAFLGRSGGTASLAEALTKQRPSTDAAKIGLRVLNSQGVPAGPLHGILQDAAEVGNIARKVTPEDIRRLLALVSTQGNATRGELVFRRASLGCQQCHAIGGAGGKVGPDLSGIGASSQLDYLLDSILLPDKIIREGYNTAHVILNDGRALSGVVVRETPHDLILRTPTIDDLAIQKKSIDERSGGGSLMPKGLASLVTDAELADLVRFLSELGKPGPFVVSHVPKARRWNVLSRTPPAFSSLDAATLGKLLLTDPQLTWTPTFTKVSGELNLTEERSSIATCQIDAAIAGPVTFKFNAADGLTLWFDGVPLEARDAITVPLTRGTHTLAVRVDHGKRQSRSLSCEIADTPGSPAQATFVGGR